MGKRGGKKHGRGRGGQPAVRADYTVIPKTNELYERYYNELGLLSDDERADFWTALRRELPNSFRFTGSKGHALSVQQRLRDHYIPQITSISYEGQPVPPPTPITWYPDKLAWQMTTPKNIVRRFPPFSSFQKFLVSETTVGNISRQEAVSMIPPLVLDVKPGMTVLDLCAAPGSKSAQLIEMVHGGEEARMRRVVRKLKQKEGREASPDGEEVEHEMEEEELQGDWEDDGRSTGLLVANDVDYRRAHMLIHQMKRLNSPNLIVMNHDATQFPSIKLPSDPAPDGQMVRGKYLKFDRILADVPCSGDGTVRKNQSIWKDWTPNNSLGLHSVQCRILVRALQMLKVGGRVVYSTCSMNPVENEAIVATAIDRCGGSSKATLVDCSSMLPELKRKSGMTNWSVMDKQGKMWKSWDEVESHRDHENTDDLSKLSEGMFPPLENEELSLERCMRILPHQQDTGAFFIAVLEKRSEIRARPESEPKKPLIPNDAGAANSIGASADPQPSIISVVDEIESKTLHSTDSTEHISAVDDLIPPEPFGQRVENASAAVRQNQENTESEATTTDKRALDEMTDSYAAAKRVKIRNADAPAPPGEEDRQVHYPPPPGAQLDLTRHESTKPTELTSKPIKKRNGQQFEEPFKYLDPNHNELTKIYDFYGLNPRFPRDRFMVRNASGDPAKTIYYTSALGRDILLENEGKGLKFVHCGVKMFVKQDVQLVNACKWRVQLDGLALVEAWISEHRIVRLYSRDTLRSLLIEMFPKLSAQGWMDFGEVGERTRDIEYGCCVLRVEKGEGEDAFHERMVLPLWRGLYSLNLMLPKEDRKAMLLRLYDDETPLADHSKDRFKSEDTTADEINENARVEAEAEDLDLDDEEDGGVRLPNEDVEMEAQVELDLMTAAKDEEDVKKELFMNKGA